MLVRVMFRLKGPSSVVGGQLAKGWNG
jgi:hypothetical protein